MRRVKALTGALQLLLNEQAMKVSFGVHDRPFGMSGHGVMQGLPGSVQSRFPSHNVRSQTASGAKGAEKLSFSPRGDARAAWLPPLSPTEKLPHSP
jgi:hypothetical protein